jgi:hypothetical protein
LSLSIEDQGKSQNKEDEIQERILENIKEEIVTQHFDLRAKT